MRSRRRLLRPVGSLLLASLLLAGADGGSSRQLLDPATGVMLGRVAVAAYPREPGSQPLEVLDPSGFEVHLVPFGDLDQEFVFPAGAWFLPPASDTYRVWIQGAGKMSPYTTNLRYGGGIPLGEKGRGLVTAINVVPAGEVALRSEELLKPNSVLRLLYAEDARDGEAARWELSRRQRVEDIKGSLMMPAGTVVGAIWDPKTRNYSEISRAFEVVAGQVVELPLERPKGVAHLVALLNRPKMASSIDDYDLEVTLEVNGKNILPAVTASSAKRVYAIWYDLAPGSGVLNASAGGAFVKGEPIDLLPGRIERLNVDLKPLPTLEVEIEVSSTSPMPETMFLKVERSEGGDVVTRREMADGSHRERFENLPATLLDISLETEIGSVGKQVDLTAGEDAFVVLEFAPHYLSGVVHYGTDPHPAKLIFRTTTSEEAEAQADDDGSYEAVLLDPVRTVEIEIEGKRGPPYVEFFSEALRETQELDFHISDTEFSASVVDAVTGQGVPSASIFVKNTPDNGATESQAGRSRNEGKPKTTVVQLTVTDDSGTGLLPPLRSGTVELRASAKGYYEMKEPVTSTVASTGSGRNFELLLEPLGAFGELKLTLPTGRPASGAEILVMDPRETPLFSGQADPDGRVLIPDNLEGLPVLARHPAAAFLIRNWEPSGDQDATHWRLVQASSRSLSVHVKDTFGEERVPRAGVALWFNGWKLSGRTLAFLTQTRPMTDRNGVWSAANLPEANVEVLAWSLGAHLEASTGALDSQAIAIQYPWPEIVEVRAAI